MWTRPVHVTAGGSGAHAPLGAIVIDLAGQASEPTVVVRGAEIPGLTPTVVRVDWPDMGVPRLTACEWRRLASALRRTGRPLHVQCQGGHGRTGTALAVLGSLMGCIPPGVDPVLAVRSAYCQGAVETAEQVAYVASMTGRAVSAPPALVPKNMDTKDKKGRIPDFPADLVGVRPRVDTCWHRWPSTVDGFTHHRCGRITGHPGPHRCDATHRSGGSLCGVETV